MIKNILFISEELNIYKDIIELLKKSMHNISTVNLLDSGDLQDIEFSKYNLIVVDYNEKIGKHLDRVNYYKLNNGFTKYLIVSNIKQEISNVEGYTAITKDIMLKSYRQVFEAIKILEPEDEFADPRKKIIIIEDDKKEVEILTRLLNNKDCKLMIFNNAMKAFAEVKRYILNSKTINLIVLNFNIPGISGYRFIEMIRNDEGTKEIPIMIITSKVEKEDILKVAKYNIRDYLSKPLNRGLFIKRVEEIIG